MLILEVRANHSNLSNLKACAKYPDIKTNIKKTEAPNPQSDLAWIVANWPKIRLEVPAATMEKIYQLVGGGMNNPVITHRIVDPALSGGSFKDVKTFFRTFRKLRGLPPLPELR